MFHRAPELADTVSDMAKNNPRFECERKE